MRREKHTQSNLPERRRPSFRFVAFTAVGAIALASWTGTHTFVRELNPNYHGDEPLAECTGYDKSSLEAAVSVPYTPASETTRTLTDLTSGDHSQWSTMVNGEIAPGPSVVKIVSEEHNLETTGVVTFSTANDSGEVFPIILTAYAPLEAAGGVAPDYLKAQIWDRDADSPIQPSNGCVIYDPTNQGYDLAVLTVNGKINSYITDAINSHPTYQRIPVSASETYSGVMYAVSYNIYRDGDGDLPVTGTTQDGSKREKGFPFIGTVSPITQQAPKGNFTLVSGADKSDPIYSGNLGDTGMTTSEPSDSAGTPIFAKITTEYGEEFRLVGIVTDTGMTSPDQLATGNISVSPNEVTANGMTSANAAGIAMIDAARSSDIAHHE